MLEMNFSTAVVLAIVIVLVCLSVRSLFRKGTCGHKEHCGGSCSGKTSSCTAADSMLDDVRKRLARSH